MIAPPLADCWDEILPHSVTPQGAIAQVTPFPAGSLLTVAMILGTVSANETVPAGAVTETTMASTVTVIEVVAAGSATAVAVMVTGVSPLGGVGGAV